MNTGYNPKKPKWSKDSKGLIISRRQSAATKWGNVEAYTECYYDLALRRITKIVGGEVLDLDTRQAVPYNETHEQKIQRRRKWIENEKRQGRKVRIKE